MSYQIRKATVDDTALMTDLIFRSKASNGYDAAFMEACRAAGWCTGDNQPYAGHLPGDAIDRHALQHGRPNVLIELRNDLVSDADGQNHWAKRLAPMLTEVLDATGL